MGRQCIKMSVCAAHKHCAVSATEGSPAMLPLPADGTIPYGVSVRHRHSTLLGKDRGDGPTQSHGAQGRHLGEKIKSPGPARSVALQKCF